MKVTGRSAQCIGPLERKGSSLRKECVALSPYLVDPRSSVAVEFVVVLTLIAGLAARAPI